MSPDTPPVPPPCVCAPLSPGIEIVPTLSRLDWRNHFDILDLEAEQLARLDEAGLWDDLNARCGTMIDIHEEATIEGAGLGPALECVARAHAATTEPEARALLDRLRALITEARHRNVPVLFLF